MQQVREILNKYTCEFPPVFELNAYNRYLKAIKKVCKKAGLTEETKTLASMTKEADGVSQIVTKPKYELIGSHIGRRSFATNYYGKIPTALIQSITGHLTESSFLMYINRERIIDKEDLMGQLINATK
jgi:integrase